VDTEARFRALFTDSYSALRRYAHHRGLSPADSEDLVAEVFTIAWRRIDDVPGDAVPWLFAVAGNVLRNTRRAERRRARLLARLPRPDVQHAVEPEHRYEVDQVRGALASLDARDRELLVLVAWDGLTPQQAAAALGWKPGATRVRLHRARHRLAAKLDASETASMLRTGTQRDRAARPEVPDART
jgi:RNA polymerase sigma factor (sigma-70 family)